MQTRQIMTTDVACCTPDAPLSDVAKMMADRDCGAIPIVEGKGSNKIIGIVTDRDIATRAVAKGGDPCAMKAADCMTRSIVSIPEDSDIQECCRIMEEHQIRRVPVTDAGGACCGIVAQADIAMHAPEHETAEVVRDVSQPRMKMKTPRGS